MSRVVLRHGLASVPKTLIPRGRQPALKTLSLGTAQRSLLVRRFGLERFLNLIHDTRSPEAGLGKLCSLASTLDRRLWPWIWRLFSGPLQ